MKRLFATMALGLAFSVHAAAPTGGSVADQLRPYLQVKTVEGDEFRVRAFFSPSCSFSKQYLPFFLNLANTLPQDKQFAFTPVVNKADGVTYAFAFAAVQRFYPRYVNNFVEASLRGVQDMGMSTRNWIGIERIGRAAGIPVPLGPDAGRRPFDRPAGQTEDYQHTERVGRRDLHRHPRVHGRRHQPVQHPCQCGYLDGDAPRISLTGERERTDQQVPLSRAKV
jgi:hypothetical protein